MITGLTVLISGYSLGETANELVTWFDNYDDDERLEPTDKDDPSYNYPDGEPSEQDILLHLLTSFYGMVVLGAIALGG